jgi:predicted ATPase
MITGISIKNFKGIDDAGIDIALAPVTMLFGSNNAGKSSVFHAFMLADEIFNNGNRNPYRIGPEGSTIDLGGFECFVNGKVLDRDVTLTFQLDPVS